MKRRCDRSELDDQKMAKSPFESRLAYENQWLGAVNDRLDDLAAVREACTIDPFRGCSVFSGRLHE
jgi:hypothetical protein